MSATTSVFVLTEQPPYMGNIKKDGAAEQIRLFLMARKRWARRQSKDTTLPTLSQLMEESDVNSLCTISLARFKREDKLKFATEYQEANEEDSAEQFWISEDEDDDSSIRGIAANRNFSAASRRDSTFFSRVPRKTSALSAIAERRNKFEAAMLEDKSLLKILSVVYGPKSQSDSLALLKGVRMSQEAPYQSLQTAADYINEFKETVKWISSTEYGLSTKTMIKQFIKGVNPAKFREELELLEIESFLTLEDKFNDLYYEHHERLEKLIAAGCVVVGPSSKERTPAEKAGDERCQGAWKGRGQERVDLDTADGAPDSATKPTKLFTPQKTESSHLTPIKPVGKGANSTMKASKADVECFHCHETGHYANACPQRTAKDAESPNQVSFSPGTPLVKRSLRLRGQEDKRAILACCMGEVSNLEPTIVVQANIDTFSDVNLVPEQWWPMLRKEGATK